MTHKSKIFQQKVRRVCKTSVERSFVRQIKKKMLALDDSKGMHLQQHTECLYSFMKLILKYIHRTLNDSGLIYPSPSRDVSEEGWRFSDSFFNNVNGVFYSISGTMVCVCGLQPAEVLVGR